MKYEAKLREKKELERSLAAENQKILNEKMNDKKQDDFNEKKKSNDEINEKKANENEEMNMIFNEIIEILKIREKNLE